MRGSGLWHAEYAWLGHVAEDVLIEVEAGKIKSITEDTAPPPNSKRLKGFTLQADGLFPPPAMKGKRLVFARPFTRTDPVLSYVDVVLFRSTLLASQFEKGRIDAYRLKPDGRLPRQPTRQTKQDVRTSPVRMAVSDDGVLYVSAGEFDRIQAFKLRQSDGLPATTPFSETDEQTGSFPNDVALAMLSEGCR